MSGAASNPVSLSGSPLSTRLSCLDWSTHSASGSPLQTSFTWEFGQPTIFYSTNEKSLFGAETFYRQSGWKVELQNPAGGMEKCWGEVKLDPVKTGLSGWAFHPCLPWALGSLLRSGQKEGESHGYICHWAQQVDFNFTRTLCTKQLSLIVWCWTKLEAQCEII